MALPDGLTPELARHILDRMGSTGQPPERGARYVNVGTSEILDVLREEYLRQIKDSGRNSSFKLVQAPFGGGKTQFLHCLRELAWSEGFCTSLVGLSPKECPFDRPVSIYKEVVRRIELPVVEIDTEPNQGIDRVLTQLVHERIEQSGSSAFSRWLQAEFGSASVESRSYQRAFQCYLEAVASGDRNAEFLIGDYLLGEDVKPAEIGPYHLREPLDDSCAFRWLRSLTQCLAASGMPGVVLMFDEMDRNISLGAKRRREIGDNLRQMIDYCGQSMLPGVLWCYAVPPEFMNTIVPEYPALAQRLKGAGQFSQASPLRPIIDLDQLPLGATDLLKEIGQRLLELSQLAFDHPFDETIQEANLAGLAHELGERQFESGTRRTFVKAAVVMLDGQRRGEEHELSQAEIRDLAGTATSGGPDLMPGETEF